MISLPDFKEKQILFVKADWGKPAKLRFFNDNIVFEKDRKVVNRISIHKTFAVFIAGDLSLTTNFFRKAKDYGVSVFLLKQNFESYGGLMTTAEGNYVLRSRQYMMSESQELDMSKNLIKNKIHNQFLLLSISGLLHGESVKNKLLVIDKKIQDACDFDSLRGIEGSVSREYFQTYFKDHNWRRRAPRTKEDEINLLLDLGYTFLFNFIDSLLRLHGFDTYKGFFHKLFFQRRSLSCDIMEPFRPLIDKQIIKAINLQQIKFSDLNFENHAFCLPFDRYTDYASIFMMCLMDHKEDIFEYVQDFYRYVMRPDHYVFPEKLFFKR